jgi:TPR repeat protein
MNAWRWKALIAVVILVVVGGSAVVFRNDTLDAGASALKVGDYRKAFEKLSTLARLGDSKAQYLLGQMYAFGWGVSKSDDEAIKWFRKAGMWSEGTTDAAAAAEYYVGQGYAEGIGVTRNEAESQKWFRRAAEGGYRPSAK